MFFNRRKPKLSEVEVQRKALALHQMTAAGEFALEKQRKAFEFNVYWQGEANRIIIERHQLIAQLAAQAQERGANLPVVLAMLSNPQIAASVAEGQIEQIRLAAYKDMQPSQITAVRATPESLGVGIDNIGRPYEMEGENATLRKQLEMEKQEKVFLKQTLKEKDKQVSAAINKPATPVVLQATAAAPVETVRERIYCHGCGFMRYFTKAGNCLTCGNPKTIKPVDGFLKDQKAIVQGSDYWHEASHA